MTKPDTGQSTACPRCHGATAIYSPYWAAWYDRYRAAKNTWQQANSDQDWRASAECREWERHSPPEHEPEERPCSTCDEHGVGDLITAGVTDTADANDRAARLLGVWRASQSTDLLAGQDALEALRAAANAAYAAADRLYDELAHAALTNQLRTATLPLTKDYPTPDSDDREDDNEAGAGR